jgi:hypothetical protein
MLLGYPAISPSPGTVQARQDPIGLYFTTMFVRADARELLLLT